MITEKKYLTIGEVVTKLRDEFSDLTISKVRFLENEGLIKPYRTSGGYRKFSPDDVGRLRTILLLQKNRYFPLNVIKKKLEEGDLDGDEAGNMEAEPQASAKTSSDLPRNIPLRDAIEITGISENELAELETFGLVHPRTTEEGKIYSATDVEIMRLSRELAHYGIQPRHLRMYQIFAEREAVFFEQILLPSLKQKSPESRKRAAQTLAELLDHSRQLKHLVLKNSLQVHLRNF
jgi:DNA-binding transcriptional MerR regulator